MVIDETPDSEVGYPLIVPSLGSRDNPCGRGWSDENMIDVYASH